MAADSSYRFEGTVLEWSERGFGFIGLADGRRAYVHHTQFGGGNLEKGETVSAVIVEDVQNPGKWAAHDVQRASLAEPRLPAVVTQWNQRGFGFIQVDDGRRAYVHASQFQGDHLEEGEQVTAVITEDAQNPGKWAAADVQRAGVAAPNVAPASYGAPASGFGKAAGKQPQKGAVIHPYAGKQSQKGAINNPWDWQGGKGPQLQKGAVDHSWDWQGGKGPSGASEERYDGTVAEWNERGYGFIKLEDGRRVYVHHTAFGGGDLPAGTTVNCSVVEDKANPGKWAASDVQLGQVKGRGKGWSPAPQAWQASEALYAAPVLASKGSSYGKVPLPKLVPVPGPAERFQGKGKAAPALAWQQVEGQVAQWNERGYGFIEAHDGRRAYVHSSAFGGGDLEVGEAVSCVLEEDAQNPGKWCAKNVQRGPAGEDGEVDSWNPQGGFGFLTMADGRRAYIHASFLGGGELVVGERLRVLLKPDPRNPGKFSVAEVLTPLTSAVAEVPQGKIPALGASQVLEPWRESEEASAEGPLTGAVTEWDDRGFGFVLLDDGRRAYVHHTAFGGGEKVTGERAHLLVGESVTVTVAPDQRNVGKIMVTTLTREEGVDAEDPAAKRNRLI